MIIALIVVIILLVFCLWSEFRTTEFQIEQECTCEHENERCVSKVVVTKCGLHRDPNLMYQCGKVQKQLEETNKIFKDVDFD